MQSSGSQALLSANHQPATTILDLTCDPIEVKTADTIFCNMLGYSMVTSERNRVNTVDSFFCVRMRCFSTLSELLRLKLIIPFPPMVMLSV